MQDIHILWVDDEIDLLKPHIIFLENKGYRVDTVNNGSDALDMIEQQYYNIVFLDENMPGLTGIETLSKIKNIKPNIPVIMITKIEEETIMEEAIGSQISDYLIKPVNPNQILLSLKKNLDERRLVSEKTGYNYQQEFRKIGMELNDIGTHQDWVEMYKRLVYWELELEKMEDDSLAEVLRIQKDEANNLFSRFIVENYSNWMNSANNNSPVMSHHLIKEMVLDEIKNNKPLFFVVIDNLRYDQWKVIEPILNQYFNIEWEEMFYSILPTATQYARNALFAGLMPGELAKVYPEKWKNENDSGSKNLYEEFFLQENLRRLNKSLKLSYNKIVNYEDGKRLIDNVSNLMQNTLNVIVYNFVDMLSHAKTEMEVIRELADDDKAYRSLTKTWFLNSPLLEVLKKISDKNGELIIATDHGTINVEEPIKIVGDRNTNTNLRYKTGKNLDYNSKEVFEVKNPNAINLPKNSLSSSFIFAKSDRFFAYPNNYNHYVKYYKKTYQHGGISLEEMLIPIVKLSSK